MMDNLLSRFTGKKKSPSPQEVIQQIREGEELLKKKLSFLECKIGEGLQTAKKYATSNRRSIIFIFSSFPFSIRFSYSFIG